MKKTKTYSRIVLFLTCFAVMGYGTFHYLSDRMNREVNPTEWAAYSTSDDKFAAKFPVTPKEQTQEMTIAGKQILYREIASETDGVVYAVSYLDFPGYWKMVGTDKLLGKAFDAFLAEAKGVEEVGKLEYVSHQGRTALNYQLKQEGNQVHGKFIISGNTLYRVSVQTPLAALESVQPGTFLESFQIKG